ncbi:MAG: nicotinate (nicotinamide) nucleotide adenylyltransferase [Chlamydiae bacterium]|nr:nicotinate (nicotinamide) nucleotide adenylyltransferase [Chlamydiota bacterium]
MAKKKIGFFGGTFDPIHFGHINLALEIKEKAKLDSVIFCPANISPHKLKQKPLASSQDRFEMVKLAIKGIEGFDISDIEIKKKGPSYTIDTLQALKGQKIELHLILTNEALEKFHLWKSYLDILKIAPPLIGFRDNFKPSKKFNIPKKNFIRTKIMQISSTDIRDRLRKKLYCNHLVPKEVLDYIYRSELYF